MLKPSKQILCLLPLLSVLLLACGEKEPAKPALTASVAPTKDAEARLVAELMGVVFGTKYRSASRDALAKMPDVSKRKQIGNYLLTAVAHWQLADGKMALVLNGQQVDQSGNPVDSHATPGLLSVYLLQKIDGQWKVLKKHENVAALGSSGSFGEVEWVNLAHDRPGMVIHNGGTWQGYTIESIALFDLKTESMHDLSGDGIRLHSDSDGGCGPETAECWNVGGKYRFVPGKPGSPYQDLLIEFSGEKSTLADKGDVQQVEQDGKAAAQSGAEGGAVASQGDAASKTEAKSGTDGEPERIISKIESRARYAFDGKRYKLVEGTNPVPQP